MTDGNGKTNGGNLAPISLEEAIQMTGAYRKRLESEGLPYEVPVQGYFISRDTILEILGQNGGNMSGIRVYFAERKNEYGKMALDLVVVGTCTTGGDQSVSDYDFNVPSINDGAGDMSASLMAVSAPVFGRTRPCPDQCGITNVLNSGVS